MPIETSDVFPSHAFLVRSQESRLICGCDRSRRLVLGFALCVLLLLPPVWCGPFLRGQTSLRPLLSARRNSNNPYQYMPTEPGKSSDQIGYEQLCTRWNREEAEAVQRCKRTLQGDSTREDKILALNELEYWAMRRGGYDAEVILIGMLKDPDKEVAGQAHISLKKTWAAHFNMWINNRVDHGRYLMSENKLDEAFQIFDKVAYENPLWGEGYHLRAKCWNAMKEVDKTIADLRRALEFCPNNYLVMVELGITLMDRKEDYVEAANLFKRALDLCPFLPVEGFLKDLFRKVPTLQEEWDAEQKANEFSLNEPPARLLPDAWVDRFEATERPNQAFLRVGGELEQWFAEVRRQKADSATQRKLWSILVIKWDPDKWPQKLKSFTTQVHEALKARRERELAKAAPQAIEDWVDDEEEYQGAKDEYDEEAVSFLRRLRSQRTRR
ncbi:unnamed protein product [Effrenium voratum]|uniref:Tetratricopeptide repeat protein n=1 Tax=Effrenium voratum TaxID=2562239 RepID=A0AA36HU57_9DINO|nr:unnamed protein product [Effrenium voratum]CAJ1375401.1 unnamed protein product [Effrenium voratum]CAJ1417407.1 unnamed protein product [Effrenium voratum]